MKLKEFQELMEKEAKGYQITFNNQQIKAFYSYMNLLLEWNEKINLTAITKPEEIILKHFIDSLTIQKYLTTGKVLDIGTGAGFPGIPLAIMREDLTFCLADSLQKRILFLEEVTEKLGLKNVKCKHARAEELGKEEEYRESFDFAVSRAVAPLNIVIEYMLPFAKLGGVCICMKGSAGKEELKQAENAIQLLGGKTEKLDEFYLGKEEQKRTICIIKKVQKTPEKYPRKPGTPTKQPL